MAIYHFSAQVISRSQGKSAVACAAYRAGEQLYDERYDKTHDYSKKKDVFSQDVLLPEGAPAWMAEREKLWNAVESIEKRKDAQLARELNFALPRELTLEQNKKLAHEFVQQHFVSKGMVADVCIHNDKIDDGSFQPHAHVMLTFREITPEGFGQKVRDWNKKENLLDWREAWANTANYHLATNEIDATIDHRTLAAQGIPLEPQHKIGCTAAKDQKAAFEDHQRIAHENGMRLLEQPAIALDALTQQHSTFTHQDIARFVNRHTLDPEQFQQAYVKVIACENLVRLGVDEHQRAHFTTKEMLALETNLLQTALDLAGQSRGGISPKTCDAIGARKQLTPEQTQAFSYLASEGQLKCVVGYAGTGKSYLLGAAREAWESQGLNVMGATLSGIAAQNLENSSGIASRTVASRLYAWEKGEQKLTSRDVLVVDEAGMLGSRQVARLLAEASGANAKVILIGDPQQLQAIEAGAAFRAINEQVSGVELTNVRRQNVPWQVEATQEFAQQKSVQALRRYDVHHKIHVFETPAESQKALVAAWNQSRLACPSDSHLILSYRRDDVFALNQLARDTRKSLGELGEDHLVQTERGERAFGTGDRLYFLKNDTGLGVKNGTLGTLLKIKGDTLTVRLDHEKTETPKDVTFSLHQYKHVEHGYAATIHKAQGVTCDRSFVLASKSMDSHATYISMTRHRKDVALYYSQEDFAHKKDLFFMLSRERLKNISLDYLHRRVGSKDIQFVAKTSPQKNYQGEQSQKLARPSPVTEKSFAPLRHEASLSDFKRSFERTNPLRTSSLREEVRPSIEKQAHLMLDEFKQLKTALSQNNTIFGQEKLAKYAHQLEKQPLVLGYIQQKDVALAKEIKALAKVHEKSLSQDEGRHL